MSWVPDGVVTSLGLRLETGVPVRLRGSLDKTAFLALGDAIEIVLAREHVEALREQTTTALGDMARAEAAETLIYDTFDAGVRARAAGEQALTQVEAAERAGATERVEWARRAAQAAIELRIAPSRLHESRARRWTPRRKPPTRPRVRPMRRGSPGRARSLR